MDDPLRVDLGQPGEDLPRDEECLGRRQRPVAPEPFLHRDAVDELPDHVVRAVGKPGEVVERRDVWMAHERGQAGLLLEPARVRVLSQRAGLGHLDDADLVEVDVTGAVDLAHPALADLVQDLVLSVEGLAGHDTGRGEAAGGTEPRVAGDSRAAARAVDPIRRHGFTPS